MSAEQTNRLKRQRTQERLKGTHSLSNIQQQPAQTEAAAQDEAFIQAQLLRSICSALAIVGYDSARPSALEMFRGQVEEYMMNFLATVKHSMASSRRTTAIPQDFILALAEAGISSHHLEPHLDLQLPASISNPPIPPPRPAEPPPPNLAPMLGRELATPPSQYAYIPSHFPPLPSRHAWQSSAVFTDREHDPRRIRERATDEGVMAEHALRKLTSANKTRSRPQTQNKAKDQLWQDTISDILADEPPPPPPPVDADGDLRLESFDSLSTDRAETAELMRSGGGLLVNHDRGHWRRGRGTVHT